MNATQAKEYAAANGFTITRTDDGKHQVTHTESGASAVRSRYDGIGVWMEAFVAAYRAELETKQEPLHEQPPAPIKSFAPIIPKVDLSSFTYALRVEHRRPEGALWGFGFIHYYRTRAEALKDARRVLSGPNGKQVARAVIERVL